MHRLSKCGVVSVITLWLLVAGTASSAFAQAPVVDPAPDPVVDPVATGPGPEAADPETPRTLALGSGARASAVSTAAVLQNPAAMALSRLYHMEVFGGFVPSAGRWSFGGTVIDSMTNQLAAGFSMRGILGNGDDGYGGMDGRLALAFPLMDQLAIGISGRYLTLAPEGQAPTDGSNVEPLAEGITMDASITVAPFSWLRIAALAQNFIDIGSPLAPVLVGGSAGIVVDSLTIGGDGLVDISTYDAPTFLAGGGAEYLAGGVVALRAGYRYDSGRHVHAVSGGLGYVDPKFGIDMSVRQDVHGADGTQLMLSFRYFVQ